MIRTPQNIAAQPVGEKADEAGSSLVSRNITIDGHRTSVRLEPDMWTALHDICRRERASLHEVCTMIAAHRGRGASLTAAIRVFIMAYFRAAATDEGHRRAGHGNGTAQGVVATIMQNSDVDATHGARAAGR